MRHARSYALANAGAGRSSPHNFINMHLPVDHRHPAAGRLRVGDRPRRRGDQAGEGHQAGRAAVSLIIQGGICYLFEYFAANFAVGNATIATRPPPGKLPSVATRRRPASHGAPIGDMINNIGERCLGNSGTTLSP